MIFVQAEADTLNEVDYLHTDRDGSLSGTPVMFRAQTIRITTKMLILVINI